MNLDVIPKICGLGIFVFAAEKVFSQAGKQNLAFLVDFIGFLLALGTVIKMIQDLFNYVGNSFPTTL